MQHPLLSPAVREFIKTHLSDPTDRLLFQAARYPEIDIPLAVGQIQARRQIQEKLPEWFQLESLFFPSRLSAEQCSSETTALYKQKLVKGDCVCDLTGGLGVDSYFFSRKVNRVLYIEKSEEYCRAATHNFQVLEANNIQILQGDARQLFREIAADTFYIDPARRSECNKRLFPLADCEPDVLQLKAALLAKAQRLIIKMSPMADITETLRLLPETSELHILAVKNECKEILAVLDPPSQPRLPVKITTINFGPKEELQEFTFFYPEEKEASLFLCSGLLKYLYEPNVAVLKSGAFKLLTERYPIQKLHLHSHLYTSAEPVKNFPGRSFTITAVHEVSGKKIKELGKRIPQAHITVRNFPCTVETLRKKSGIAEGGDIYLFATTLSDTRKQIIECRKLS